MALPTVTGSWRYPYENSPERTFYQGHIEDSVGTFNLIGTISSTKPFVLTYCKIDFASTISGACDVTIKNDLALRVYARSVDGIEMNFFPMGIKSSVADTASAQAVISGAGNRCSVYVEGYIE